MPEPVHTLVVSGERPCEEIAGTVVVGTPLDLIAQLESQPIATVVLVGRFAADAELGAFLAESYPAIELELS